MARAKGIQTHMLFKLGKAPAKADRRNLMFATLVRAPVPAPNEYDFDLVHPGVPTPMFGNDQHGDCVMAGRAHQTLRFELIEQKKVITITDKDVLREYTSETGGPDTGLVVLDSLKEWRSKGWRVGKRRYNIKAFAQIDQTSADEMKGAVYMDIGVGIGLSLPKSAQQQIAAGKPWDVTTGPAAAPNSWGGHYVFVPGYTASGPVCVTWGRKQQMTWSFIRKYCDEAYAVFDAADSAKKTRFLKMATLDKFLAKHP